MHTVASRKKPAVRSFSCAVFTCTSFWSLLLSLFFRNWLRDPARPGPARLGFLPSFLPQVGAAAQMVKIPLAVVLFVFLPSAGGCCCSAGKVNRFCFCLVCFDVRQVRPEVQRMLTDEFYPPLDSATEVRLSSLHDLFGSDSALSFCFVILQ